MKRLVFILWILIINFLSLQAQNILADLVIVSPDEPIAVYLNNTLMTRGYHNKVIINNLAGGFYNVNIIFQNRALPQLMHQITVNTNSMNVYKVEKAGTQFTLVHLGVIPYISVLNSNQFPVPPTPQPQPQPVPDDGQVVDDNDFCNPPSNADFQNMIQTIENTSFESDKENVAKQIIASNCLTSNQVKQILQLFSFEDTKLDLAKYAYNYVYDPQNYYVVYDVFSFSSSKTKLSKYINNQN